MDWATAITNIKGSTNNAVNSDTEEPNNLVPPCHCKAIALTPVITKCFEKLVLHYNCIKTTSPPTFDSHQFVYKGNGYTEGLSVCYFLFYTHCPSTPVCCVEFCFLCPIS